jgi:hypothetical protein
MEKPDFTVTRVGLPEDYREGLIDISWGTKSAGFGHLSFRNEGDDIICSSENMSPEFVKEVLLKLVDVAKFKD